MTMDWQLREGQSNALPWGCSMSVSHRFFSQNQPQTNRFGITRQSIQAHKTVRQLMRRQKQSNEPVSVEQNVLNARNAVKKAFTIVHNLMVSVMRGRSIEVDEVKQLAKDIPEQINLNNEALVYCCRQKKPDQYTQMRSISFSALMVNFAKSLGYSRVELEEIALGSLLHDIGKMWVSQHLLHKKGRLSFKEFSYLKEHVAHSALILDSLNVTGSLLSEIVSKHHERIDGSGYPYGLTEAEISRIAQMAMIVDVFDALTSERGYKKALTPFQALHYLSTTRREQFNQELVQHFIKSIGLYPMGTIVKLHSDLIGVVIGQTESLLKPVVKVFYDMQNKKYIAPRDIDLLRFEQKFSESVAVSPISNYKLGTKSALLLL